MIVLRGDSANELLVAACHAVRSQGRPVQPRGLATTEVLGAHMCLTDPRRRLVDLPPARILNPAFAIAEAVWILSGSDEPWIFAYNRQLERYADGGRLQGAYGPRLRHWQGRVDQLDEVRQLLARDHESRQAVIQLFDPDRDWHGHRDVPCTLGYRFFVRDGALHMHTSMRSQDLWLGFPYDVFTNTLLQELLAGWLDVDLGEYHHHVDSLHLYAHDLDPAAALSDRPTASFRMPDVVTQWTLLPGLLNGVRDGTPPPTAGPVWSEFAAVLTSYRVWTSGDRDTARQVADATPGQMARALVRWYTHLQSRASTSASKGKAVSVR